MMFGDAAGRLAHRWRVYLSIADLEKLVARRSPAIAAAVDSALDGTSPAPPSPLRRLLSPQPRPVPIPAPTASPSGGRPPTVVRQAAPAPARPSPRLGQSRRRFWLLPALLTGAVLVILLGMAPAALASRLPHPRPPVAPATA